MQIGGLGTNSTATLGGTSQIQKSAKKTVENAMTDGFVEQIKEMARKDAQTGVYMSDEFAQMRQAYKTRYVSPNRSGLQGQVMSFMQRAAMGGNRGNFLMRLLGGYSMKASLGIHSQYNTAEVFAPNGYWLVHIPVEDSGLSFQLKQNRNFWETLIWYILRHIEQQEQK